MKGEKMISGKRRGSMKSEGQKGEKWGFMSEGWRVKSELWSVMGSSRVVKACTKMKIELFNPVLGGCPKTFQIFQELF